MSSNEHPPRGDPEPHSVLPPICQPMGLSPHIKVLLEHFPSAPALHVLHWHARHTARSSGPFWLYPPPPPPLSSRMNKSLTSSLAGFLDELTGADQSEQQFRARPVVRSGWAPCFSCRCFRPEKLFTHTQRGLAWMDTTRYCVDCGACQGKYVAGWNIVMDPPGRIGNPRSPGRYMVVCTRCEKLQEGTGCRGCGMCSGCVKAAEDAVNEPGSGGWTWLTSERGCAHIRYQEVCREEDNPYKKQVHFRFWRS